MSMVPGLVVIFPNLRAILSKTTKGSLLTGFSGIEFGDIIF
jgi:hypothetical protein